MRRLIARLGIGAKLAIASTLLLLFAAIGIERLSSVELEAAMIARVSGELSTKLGWLEDTVAVATPLPGRASLDSTTWDAIADRFGERSGARVTLIAANGVVVGDSEVAEGELSHLENHAGREEIAQAREHGDGSTIRLSPTLGVRMIYAARRYPHPEQGVAFVRLAVPLFAVDAALAGSRRFVALGTVIAVAVAIAASIVGTHRLTRPIRVLTGAALAMSRGNLDIRAETRGGDEAAHLAVALNQLASELARTIRELRDDRDLLASILDGMGEGVLVLDADGRIVLANRALRGMTLLAPDALGRSVLETLRNAALQEALERARVSEEAVVREVEMSGLSPRRVLVRVSRLAESRGEPGTIAVFHDVTDLRRLETIRTDFVANVSHELRTPVTAISTAAETLLGGAVRDPDEALEFASVIDRQARRLRQLVDDLLDLSKIEAKAFRLNPVDLDLTAVVDHATRLMVPRAEKRRTKLSFVRPKSAARVRADRRAMEQVLSNLIDNAVKYAGDGARITVAIEADGDRTAVSVADDGPGIPAAHVGRIFERFYRVDPGSSREMGGTGLGLSIVKHLVDQMGGTIDVESEPGRGTRFVVRLARVA